MERHLRRLLGGSGLLGLGTTGLGLGGRLGLALGAADGRDTLDSGLTEVGTVAVLGSLVGNSLVGAVETRQVSISTSFPTAILK